jgi:hypothetical protein
MTQDSGSLVLLKQAMHVLSIISLLLSVRYPWMRDISAHPNQT